MSNPQSMFKKVQLFNVTSGAETYDKYDKENDKIIISTHFIKPSK